ncbi:hypothetical protein L249_3504, partial [Ophiocordyceps polyrhachis-furcata BCC 54312]
LTSNKAITSIVMHNDKQPALRVYIPHPIRSSSAVSAFSVSETHGRIYPFLLPSHESRRAESNRVIHPFVSNPS